MTAQLIDAAEGSEAANPNHMTLFVKYTNSGTNNTTKAFADNEVLTIRNRATSDFIVAANTLISSSTGLGTRASVSDGIIFHKGRKTPFSALQVLFSSLQRLLCCQWPNQNETGMMPVAMMIP